MCLSSFKICTLSAQLEDCLVDRRTYLEETLLVWGHMIERNVGIICFLAN